VCVNCCTKFQRSFTSFDPLPLVEFKLDDRILKDEARPLIDMPHPPIKSASAGSNADAASIVASTTLIVVIKCRVARRSAGVLV
jgi:hypothetical protein